MSKRYGDEYDKVKQEHFKDNGVCLGKELMPQVKCAGVLTIHHSKGKEGDLLTDKRYFKTLCRAHHDRVHRNPEEAIELGLTDLKK